MAIVGSSATALGLRLPAAGRLPLRSGLRRGLRLLAYAAAVFVFVVPLWSMLATALSSSQSELGKTFLYPHGLTGGNFSTAWSFGVGADCWTPS